MFKVSLLLSFLLLRLVLAQGQTDSSKEVQQLIQGAPVEREMKAGEVHKYQISLSTGQFIQIIVEQRGIDVVVTTFRPDGKKIGEIDSPNGTQGPEPVSIAAETSGIYQMEVRSFDATAVSGRYEIKIKELLSAEQYRVRLAEEKARDEAIIAQLRNGAIPLSSVMPGSSFNDLMSLKKTLENVRVVGLGEATHGTHEFFQLRHRLLEFLVKEMGFTGLAVEASYAATLKINDYVLQGKGDRAKVLAEQKTWILDTEEIAEIIDWLRTYNQSVPEEKRVKIFGIDPQVNEIAMNVVIDYLRKVAPERVPSVETTFDKIRLEDTKAINFDRTEVSSAQLSELYRLISYLVLNKANLVYRTSTKDFEEVLQYLRLLAQFAEFNSATPLGVGGTRDAYMAENFQSIVNAEKPTTRFIIWAHNAHISTRDTGNFPAMGSYLRKNFGNSYYAFGFTFNQGSFQAQISGEGKVRVQEFTLGPAPERTIDWYLARAGVGNCIIDLRHLPKDEKILQWLQATQRMHWIGAIFSDKWTESQWTQPFVLSRDFDGLFFVEKTTRARPTPTGKREGL
ncbi:MAG: erythromycin esterase family protein [Acidobacteriota bacterium]